MAGPRKPDRVYLDSSVWLSWFDGQVAQPAVRRVLEWAETGQLQLLVSPLHLVEVLGRRPSVAPGEPDPAVLIEEYFTAGPVTVVEFDVRVAQRARQLRLDQTMKEVADSIHLAHAIVGRADVLFTLDVRDFPLDTTIGGVFVAKPYVLGDEDLFTNDS